MILQDDFSASLLSTGSFRALCFVAGVLDVAGVRIAGILYPVFNSCFFVLLQAGNFGMIRR